MSLTYGKAVKVVIFDFSFIYHELHSLNNNLSISPENHRIHVTIISFTTQSGILTYITSRVLFKHRALTMLCLDSVLLLGPHPFCYHSDVRYSGLS